MAFLILISQATAGPLNKDVNLLYVTYTHMHSGTKFFKSNFYFNRIMKMQVSTSAS